MIFCLGCNEPAELTDGYCFDCRPSFTCEGPGDGGNGCEDIGPMSYVTKGGWQVKLRACASCHKEMTKRQRELSRWERI